MAKYLFPPQVHKPSCFKAKQATYCKKCGGLKVMRMWPSEDVDDEGNQVWKPMWAHYDRHDAQECKKESAWWTKGA
jgi:hypothetical protein